VRVKCFDYGGKRGSSGKNKGEKKQIELERQSKA